jgi:hypothetical protein
LVVEKLIELTSRALPIPRINPIFKILVQHLRNDVALQGPINACANQLGVLALEVTGCKSQGTRYGFTKSFEISHALLVRELDRGQDAQCLNEQIHQRTKDEWAIQLPGCRGVCIIFA